MVHIKEPYGIDFVIKGKPLTVKQKREISEFIKADKAKQALVKKRLNKLRTTAKKSAKQPV